MFPKFIEVHDAAEGGEIFINIASIEGVFIECPVAGKTVTHIDVADGDCYTVSESYDEVKDLILKTGCLIQKGDPRLDTSRPLTMEDLCCLEMIGQPVWNSNTLKWMTLIDSAPDGRSWVDLVSNSGKTVRMEPHDVRKFPLYRMRKEP